MGLSTALRPRGAVIILAVALTSGLMSACGQVDSPTGTDAATADKARALTAEPTTTAEHSETASETAESWVEPEGNEDVNYSMVVRDVSALCRGESGMPGNWAYQPESQQPHWVLIADGDPDTDYQDFRIPTFGYSDDGLLDYSQYKRAQLVACVDAREGLELELVCGVQGHAELSFEIYSAASYHVTVYTAVTGEQIAETTLTGSEPAVCPFGPVYFGDETVVRSYTSPSQDSLKAFLAPLIGP